MSQMDVHVPDKDHYIFLQITRIHFLFVELFPLVKDVTIRYTSREIKDHIT